MLKGAWNLKLSCLSCLASIYFLTQCDNAYNYILQLLAFLEHMSFLLYRAFMLHDECYQVAKVDSQGSPAVFYCVGD
uniref:Uncharacterized protein n=1 Tax=Aegilops tauschii subsp. strangulata TaxID=200361 RepID=A0A453BZY0_AEGTS